MGFDCAFALASESNFASASAEDRRGCSVLGGSCFLDLEDGVALGRLRLDAEELGETCEYIAGLSVSQAPHIRCWRGLMSVQISHVHVSAWGSGSWSWSWSRSRSCLGCGCGFGVGVFANGLVSSCCASSFLFSCSCRSISICWSRSALASRGGSMLVRNPGGDDTPRIPAGFSWLGGT